jgi:signal transduction histidine kinase
MMIDENTMPGSAKAKFLAFLLNLVRPYKTVEDELERLRLRFANTWLVLFSGVMLFIVTVFIFYLPNPPLVGLASFLFFAHLLGYAVSQSRAYKWAIPISTLSTHLAIWTALFVTPFDIAMGVLFTTSFALSTAYLWFDRKITYVSALGNVFVIVLASSIKGFPLPSAIFAFLIVIAMTAILAVQSAYRRSLEDARIAILDEAVHRAEEAKAATEAANLELQRASAIAKENARLRSEFMATMSHELRTPLNAIRGFCGIMLDGMGGEIDEDARHMINRIHDNGNRLLTLINDILDLARIEAGRMEAQKIPFNPQKLFKASYEQMTALASEKGLEFNLKLGADLPEILIGDPERITQIVVNLLSNAFKFTHEGRIALEVSLLESSWQIAVKDTGIGIPEHALNYIFDEFRQLDSSSMRNYGGSGLGLSIVRNLSRMMDGSIQVESQVNQGSTFTLTLPLILEASKNPEPAL